MSATMTNRYSGKTVLVIGAHPDDIEIGIGGTVAQLKKSGAHVVMAVGCIPNQYEKRVAEAQRAADILGGELRFLFNHGCSRIEDVKTYEIVKKIDDLVMELKPAALISHGSADFHKDHQVMYNACLASQRLQFLDFFCYYPTACRPVPVKFHPHAYVDISDTLETKMAALNAHNTQFLDRGLETDFIRDIAREQGRMAGVPYAEALEVVRMLLLN
jgi:LmbE family N-acetylglucosaminyl deacetylase